MKRRVFCFLLFSVVFSTLVFSQPYDHEFVGVIKLRGNLRDVITFKLLFNVKAGKVQGESITDINGDNQTQNLIEGTYNPSSGTFLFKETDIIYTKSKYDKNDFCFISFNGKLKDSSIKGDYIGFFPDGKSCIDGQIEMVSAQRVSKMLEKAQRKIDSSRKISAQEKSSIKPMQFLDSLRTNYLKKDENLNLFVSQSRIYIEIWDSGQIDGDIVDVFVNDSLVAYNHTIGQEKKIIPVDVKSELATFKIKAKDEGRVEPNTAKMQIRDGDRVFSLTTNLKKNESSSISIRRKIK